MERGARGSGIQNEEATSIPVKDCFSKKELIQVITKVHKTLMDKYIQVAETPPRSVAIWEDTNLLKELIKEMGTLP